MLAFPARSAADAEGARATFDPAFIRALQDGVVVLDADGRVVQVNRSMCEISGYAEAEWIGAAAPYPIWPEEHLKLLTALLAEAFASASGRHEVEFKRRNGERFPAVVDVGPVSLGEQPGMLFVVRDVAGSVRERMGLLAEARAARDFLQATLDSLTAEVAVLGRGGEVIAANLAWRRAEGPVTVGESYLARWQALAAVDSRAAALADALRGVLAGERDAFELEYEDGAPASRRFLSVHLTRHRADGEIQVVVQRDDVTEQRRAQEALRFQARLLEEVDAAVVATDLDGNVTHWTDGAARLYGWTREESVGRNVADLGISPREREAAGSMLAAVALRTSWEAEFLARRKDGVTVPVYLRLAPVEAGDETPMGYIGVAVDVTERVRAATELRSARDQLRAVIDSMGEGLYAVDGEGRLTYMNSAAERLLGYSGAELTGRSMHAVVHAHHADGTPYPESDCAILGVRATAEPVRVDDDSFRCKDGSALPVAFTSAPLAGEDGVSGAVVVFSDASEARAKRAELERDAEALNWIARIRDALHSDRFVLYAQPIVEIATGATVQHELLIRMLDEDGSLVPPGVFLPVAEEYGLIREIDRWVLGQAAELAAAGHPIEVNLSAESLGDASLLGYVEQELLRTGADPSNLVFELTETGLLRDEASAQSFIEGVARLGSHVALDDFGTGYGGFTYVKRLPVDFLKIDVEFVRDLPHNPASAHVVRAVVNLARDFGHRTIAEGVEDDQTLELLRRLGVDFAQGYGIGRPAPLEQRLGAR
jgi:PAS domain S-box-containing protein